MGGRDGSSASVTDGAADGFSETTSQSWFSRIGGVLAGPLAYRPLIGLAIIAPGIAAAFGMAWLRTARP